MKKLLCIALVMLLVFSVIGCTNTDTSEQPAETTMTTDTQTSSEVADTTTDNTATDDQASKTWVIGFNNFNDSNEFCKKVHDSIAAAADEYGVELLYAEANMDGQTMIANTEQFIIQGADLMIDFNWVPEIGATMLDMCNEAGIPLISMDTIYEGTYYFGANSYIAGQVLGEYLATQVADRWDGQIDAIVGCWYQGGGDIVKDRVVGAEDALKAAEGITLPDDDMIFEVDAGASDQAATLKAYATDFLTAHPDLHHVIFLANNDESGAGLFAGIELAGREADCFIGTTGGDTPFQDHIRAGGGDVWLASTSFAPEKYGEQVIPMAIDILEGKDVPMEVFMNHFVITKDNIDEYYPQ